MTAGCIFIGDELSAAGWRLAGADCRTPAPAEAAALLRSLRRQPHAGLIILSAEHAEALPPALLKEALATQQPACVVVADSRGRHRPADLTRVLKRQLGLAE